MTLSPPAVLLGAQRPRLASCPTTAVTSAGAEAVELAASAGLVLDDWQAWVLEQALGERADGKWAAFEVGLVVPRQNGKGSVLEAVELAGLFLFGERLILHSAHEFKTAQEAFRRVLQLVQNTPDLERRVARVRTSHGEEGIELRDGARLRFVARSTGSGRGFSGDRVILDEAYNLSAESMAALLPTLSARPNPQLWYTSSAGMDSSDQLRRIRERGMAGGDEGLAYFEWSAEDGADHADPGAHAQANPGYGTRIPAEFVERERAALPAMEFARERLGIWDDHGAEAAIDAATWAACADPGSRITGRLALAVEKSERYTVVAAAGETADGKTHVEVIESRRGTSWVVERVTELVDRHDPVAVVLDPSSPAGMFLNDLRQAGVEVAEAGAREVAQGCVAFDDDVVEGRIVHLGEPVLTVAVAGSKRKATGDSWRWDRRGKTDISPLVAVTLARHGLAKWKAENVDDFPIAAVWA